MQHHTEKGNVMIPKNIERLRETLKKTPRDARWAVLIAPDPDAMASAMAFKYLIKHRAQSVRIAGSYRVTRPDNLAMIRYLRIPLEPLTPELRAECTHFALVDSQPHHNPAFEDIPFTVVIDHHPVKADAPVTAPFTDIRPSMGAASTIMTRYIRALRKKPGKLLTTALLYGIRTDTAAFERGGGADDLNAYQWLSKHADTAILRRIVRSEYLLEWLPFFSRAFESLQPCRGKGEHAHVGRVDSGDQLVAIADFFTRVHGLKWVVVSGVCGNTVIVIFRGDGSHHVGTLASAGFSDIGSGGGHHNMARAEFPLHVVGSTSVRDFVFRRLQIRKSRTASAKQAQ